MRQNVWVLTATTFSGEGALSHSSTSACSVCFVYNGCTGSCLATVCSMLGGFSGIDSSWEAYALWIHNSSLSSGMVFSSLPKVRTFASTHGLVFPTYLTDSSEGSEVPEASSTVIQCRFRSACLVRTYTFTLMWRVFSKFSTRWSPSCVVALRVGESIAFLLPSCN